MKRKKKIKRNPKMLEKQKKKISNEKLRQVAGNTGIIKATFTVFGIAFFVLILAICLQVIK